MLLRGESSALAISTKQKIAHLAGEKSLWLGSVLSFGTGSNLAVGIVPGGFPPARVVNTLVNGVDPKKSHGGGQGCRGGCSVRHKKKGFHFPCRTAGQGHANLWGASFKCKGLQGVRARQSSNLRANARAQVSNTMDAGVRDFRTGGVMKTPISAVVSEASAKQVNGGLFSLPGSG